MSQLEQIINAEIGRRDDKKRELMDKVAGRARVVSALHNAMRPEMEYLNALFEQAGLKGQPCTLGSMGITLKNPLQNPMQNFDLHLSVYGDAEFSKGYTIEIFEKDPRGTPAPPIFRRIGVNSPDGETLCDANGFVDKPVPSPIAVIETMLTAYLKDFQTQALIDAAPKIPATPIEHVLWLREHEFRLKGEPGQACSIAAQWNPEPSESSAEQTAYAMLEAQILALYSEGVLIQNEVFNPAVLRSLETVMDALPNIVDRFEEDDFSDAQVPVDPAPRG